MKIIKTGGKMRRSYVLLTLCYFLLAGILAGCGGGSGSPGSSGSEVTGIQIQSVTITSEAGPRFDVYSYPNTEKDLNICSGSSETLIHAEDAIMSITSAKLNPSGGFNPFPASVEECTITYKKANEDPSAPVIESLTLVPNCKLDGTGTNDCLVPLIDETRKRQYWNGIADGVYNPAEYPTHYVAVYRCKYMNLVGKSGYFTVEYDIWLADYLVCG